MAVQLPSQQELYDLFRDEVQNRNPNLTDWEEGSKLDSLGGGVSVAGQELLKKMVEFFAKTYFSTANGIEVTGTTDDLEFLAVDHFGDTFARPQGNAAQTVVTFTRPDATGGAGTILAGTIVKTVKDANGREIRFAVASDVSVSGVALSVNASVEAVEVGTEGNVNANTITVIESAIFDASFSVTNALAATSGQDVLTDAEYREFLRNKIETLRGATKAAIEAAANNVPGVEIATAIEFLQAVKEWDIGGNMAVGEYFYIPRVKLYIADANGTATAPLIEDVEDAIDLVRACGVRVEVLGATALAVNWSATITLNPSGPNFAELSTDTTKIVASMTEYIKNLPIGTGFNKITARAAILAIWGAAGTDDLTDFQSTIPTGNISATEVQKLVPGTIEAGT